MKRYLLIVFIVLKLVILYSASANLEFINTDIIPYPCQSVRQMPDSTFSMIEGKRENSGLSFYEFSYNPQNQTFSNRQPIHQEGDIDTTNVDPFSICFQFQEYDNFRISVLRYVKQVDFTFIVKVRIVSFNLQNQFIRSFDFENLNCSRYWDNFDGCIDIDESGNLCISDDNLIKKYNLFTGELLNTYTDSYFSTNYTVNEEIYWQHVIHKISNDKYLLVHDKALTEPEPYHEVYLLLDSDLNVIDSLIAIDDENINLFNSSILDFNSTITNNTDAVFFRINGLDYSNCILRVNFSQNSLDSIQIVFGGGDDLTIDAFHFDDEQNLVFLCNTGFGICLYGLYDIYTQEVGFPMSTNGIYSGLKKIRDKYSFIYGFSSNELGYKFAIVSKYIDGLPLIYVTLDNYNNTNLYYFQSAFIQNDYAYFFQGDHIFKIHYAINTPIQDIVKPEKITVRSYPNPFQSGESVSFKSESDKISKLDVYNIKGQKVFSCSNNSNIVHWNGKDLNNKNVAKGIYLTRIKVGNTYINKKIIKM